MRKVMFLSVFLVFAFFLRSEDAWIRINQVRYLPDYSKVAVLITKNPKFKVKEFFLYDSKTNEEVYKSSKITEYGKWGAFEKGFRLNFSDFKKDGEYYISTGAVKSPVFKIGSKVYYGTADFILNYMRQQRCGYNPFLRKNVTKMMVI